MHGEIVIQDYIPYKYAAVILGSARKVRARQEASARNRPLDPARYTVTDLGTLPGGNFSEPFFITKDGHVSGTSNLNGGASHAVLWSRGQVTDLGTLRGSNSMAFSANAAGKAAGEAETSVSDPNGEDFCGFGTHLICLPFESAHGVMNPLPTLGANNGAVNMINRRGTAVGWAETSIPDPACPAPQVLHFQPAVWRDGKVHRLPTYPGDPDGLAAAVNNRGQIVGSSGTCTTFQPTLVNLMGVHPLMWDNGKPIDLGNLGGTTGADGGNIAWSLNNRGQVVGVSDLPGDTEFHAFLWSKATGMKDLGMLSAMSTARPPTSTTTGTSSASPWIKASTAARSFGTTQPCTTSTSSSPKTLP